MPDEILSQNEIDALLSAMSKGEVDLETDISKDEEVVAYDLTSKSVILTDQFQALEEVFIKFTGYLQDAISSTIKKPVEVEFVSSEMIKYKDFIKSFTYPTGFNIFTMEPLIGSAMVVLEPSLLFSLIDCMFGGNGKPLDIEREFTNVDRRMMQKVVGETLKELQKAWTSIMPIRPMIKKIEANPEFVHLVAPEDFVITNNFEINGEEFQGLLYLCLSYLMLEPIKERLSADYLNKKESDFVWNAQLQHLLKGTDVTVIAELGQAECTISDLLELDVNDVLKLNTGPEDLIRINIENVTKFNGYPGILKGNRAIQVTKAGSQTGGKLSNGLGIK